MLVAVLFLLPTIHAQLYARPPYFQGYLNAYPSGQYQLGLTQYENPLLSSRSYNPYGVSPISRYGDASSHWYMGGGATTQVYGGNGGYYGLNSHDSAGYNPLLLHSGYSPMETSSYLSMIHDKENFQPQGCAFDPVQQRCMDSLGLCRGGCRDFSNAYSLLRDCRCIPYGYSALMRLVGGLKKTKKV